MLLLQFRSLLQFRILVLLISISSTIAYSFQSPPSRRELFKQAISSSLTVAASTWRPNIARAETLTNSGVIQKDFSVYKVIPDASERLSPSIESVKVRD
jgi:hypothetical protein